MADELVEVPADFEALAGTPRVHLPNDPPSQGRELLEQHLHVIRQRIEHLSRSSGLPEHEAEELCSWALFKLVEKDYRILGSWKGLSSFSTFLTVVLVNLMRDYRIHVWGKWRPSVAARRLGPEAVLLERLCVRDKLSLDEAIERMRGEHGSSLSPSELERMAISLRRGPERKRVGEEELLQVAIEGQVESRITEGERARTEQRLREVLTPLIQSLSTQDRLLLKLHYRDGLSIAVISALWGQPQRKLYSARDKCLKRLRRNLEKVGLSFDQVRDLPGRSNLDLAPHGI